MFGVVVRKPNINWIQFVFVCDFNVTLALKDKSNFTEFYNKKSKGWI